jgi:transposase InsO family protein
VKTLSPRYGSVAYLCRLLGLAPSSYYYNDGSPEARSEDTALSQALQQLAGDYPTYGYRRLSQLLRRRKRFSHVNSKRVRRLMKRLGLQAKRPRRRWSTTDSAHPFRRYPNLVRALGGIDHPNQVWVCDITYIVLATGEVVFLAIVMEVFTRTIRGWALGRDLTHTLTVTTLQRALKRGRCEIHHSDQGVQYATPHYTQLLAARGIQISLSDTGQPWQNGYAERFMRTLKEEEVYLSAYETYEAALKQIGQFIQAVYNRKRIHSALGDLSPTEFEVQWQAEHST